MNKPIDRGKGRFTSDPLSLRKVVLMMARASAIDSHPDITEMRRRYEWAGARPSAQAIDGFALLAGLYLAISPWVIGFNDLSRLTVINLIVGLALAVLAAGFASAYGRTHGVSWVAPILGLWTIMSPWVIREADTATIWNNVVTGIVILLLGIGAVAVGTSRRT
ncbi:SPW repeat protein [Nonomuraea sp. SYSU D8015]|uniref:SPW repeat protein n=1 Tax=Nonomuraea sp. SYSU D8015 TaxID=2593644 RepID=UPI001CB6C865|nr:SPW repeat protein [Nonomuraea sp. SYSU D8015]